MTIYHLARFLQSPAENPHATLIMLFMNAVGEATTDVDDRRDAGPNFMTILKYMPFNGLPSSPYDSGVLMRHAAQTIIRDHDKYFNRYVSSFILCPKHKTYFL